MATKVPTATNIQKAKTAFEGMDYQKQQDFIAKNKDFDVNKLWFKLQAAPVVAPVENKLLPNQTVKDKFVDTSILEQQNNAGVLSSTTQQENTSNIPQNDIKGSQKNDVISTPTEVKTDKVETTKDTWPSKTDNTTDRLTEIQTNLQNYASNPDFQQYFKTQDAFNNYFGREQRTPEQQKVLDSFYTWYKVEQDKKVANNARYLTLSTMSDTDLQNVNDTNDIALISLDPNLKARYDAAQKNKQIMEFVYWKDYNKTDTTPDGLDNIADNYSQEYAAATGELTKTKNEMDKIQDTIDSTYDKLVKQYEWTWETDAYIRAKAGKINSELTDQYNDLARKYNTQLWTVSALQATEDRKKEEQASNIALANQKMQMYNFLYGMPSAQKEEIPVQTKDFWTAKAHNWKQSLDGGKTRQSISGISWWGTTWGGTGTWGGWATDVSWIDLSWVDPKKKNLASLIWQYKNLLDSTNWADLQTNSLLQAQRNTLKWLITAEYKKAMTLWTLDLWVQKLMDSILWAGWIGAVSTYSNAAQSNSAQMFLESVWWKVVAPKTNKPWDKWTPPIKPDTIVTVIPDDNILAKDSKLTPQPTNKKSYQKIWDLKLIKYIKNLFK